MFTVIGCWFLHKAKLFSLSHRQIHLLNMCTVLKPFLFRCPICTYILNVIMLLLPSQFRSILWIYEKCSCSLLLCFIFFLFFRCTYLFIFLLIHCVFWLFIPLDANKRLTEIHSKRKLCCFLGLVTRQR